MAAPEALTAALDPEAVRQRFAALAAPDAPAFFDGPGGSQVPEVVIEAMAAYLRSSNANLGGAFATSVETTRMFDAARAALADFTGSAPEEIAFGANMTTLNFLLAHAVARTLAAGDEIVVTELDHDANVAPWEAVAGDHGLVVRRVPVRQDGALDEDALEEALGERTRVVAFGLASNALGSIPDAERIVRAAHRVGALAWADAVHMAPHHRLSRERLGLDVLLCSPYKFFGPHLGVAALRRDLAETLPADRVRPASEWPPGHRFETGTQSHEAIAGALAAVDYVASLGEGPDRHSRLDSAFARIEKHERALTARFLDGLPGNVELYGLRGVERRTPTFAFNVAGMPPLQVAERLARQGLYVGNGDFYAPAPLRALGQTEVLRAGFLHYTTAGEVDRLLESLAAARE